jgi:hypothetical protein
MADDVKHGREFGSIEQQALEHVWIHSARWLDLAERDGLRVMVRGEGCRLFDARGRSYLDGLAGLYVVNVGHGRTEIAEAMAERWWGNAGGRPAGLSSNLREPTVRRLRAGGRRIRTLGPPSENQRFFETARRVCCEPDFLSVTHHGAERGWPTPPGAMAIMMRTGKLRSAVVCC